MSKELINWNALSQKLAGNDSIRRNKMPKKYEQKVKRLIRLLETWEDWANKA